MRSIIFACLMAIGTFVFSSSGSQALPVDFIDNGSYTTDLASGLDWLDVTETKRMSYNSVNAQLGAGGAYEGWRYATMPELRQMIFNWTGVAVPVPKWSFTLPRFSTTGLISLLGSTHDETGPHIQRISSGILDFEPYFHENPGVYTHKVFSISFDFIPETGSEYSAFNNVMELDDTRRSPGGSFLVRNSQLSVVPLPAAVWVFGAALAGLGWLTRRQKQAN